MSLITGDGGGYVDLPEFYFNISTVHNYNVKGKFSLKYSYESNSQENCYYTKKDTRDRIILYTDNHFYPSEFVLIFNLRCSVDFLKEEA